MLFTTYDVDYTDYDGDGEYTMEFDVPEWFVAAWLSGSVTNETSWDVSVKMYHDSLCDYDSNMQLFEAASRYNLAKIVGFEKKNREPKCVVTITENVVHQWYLYPEDCEKYHIDDNESAIDYAETHWEAGEQTDYDTVDITVDWEC